MAHLLEETYRRRGDALPMASFNEDRGGRSRLGLHDVPATQMDDFRRRRNDAQFAHDPRLDGLPVTPAGYGALHLRSGKQTQSIGELFMISISREVNAISLS